MLLGPNEWILENFNENRRNKNNFWLNEELLVALFSRCNLKINNIEFNFVLLFAGSFCEYCREWCVWHDEGNLNEYLNIKSLLQECTPYKCGVACD